MNTMIESRTWKRDKMKLDFKKSKYCLYLFSVEYIMENIIKSKILTNSGFMYEKFEFYAKSVF